MPSTVVKPLPSRTWRVSLSIFLPHTLLIDFTAVPSNLMLIALNGLEVIKKRNSYVKRVTDNEYYGVVATLL
jgi:hypothetical protein